MKNPDEIVAVGIGHTCYCIKKCRNLSDGEPMTRAQVLSHCLHPGWSVICEQCREPIVTAPNFPDADLPPLDIHSEKECVSIHPVETHDEWWQRCGSAER